MYASFPFPCRTSLPPPARSSARPFLFRGIKKEAHFGCVILSDSLLVFDFCPFVPPSSAGETKEIRTACEGGDGAAATGDATVPMVPMVQ